MQINAIKSCDMNFNRSPVVAVGLYLTIFLSLLSLVELHNFNSLSMVSSYLIDWMSMLLLRKRVILVPKTIEIIWISAAHNSFVL